MLSLFSIPKPFDGHVGTIQRNATESWKRLPMDVQITLFGNEPGVEEAAADAGVQHVPDVARNEYGTPLLSDVFAKAAAMSRSEWLCYINADIVLLDAFAEAMKHIADSPALLVTQRMNVDIDEPLDFDADWRAHVRRMLDEQAVPASLAALDLFVFPRAAGLTELPPFAVGRPGWDNWFVWNARHHGLPIVDGSDLFQAVHQNHGYGHVPGAYGDRWHGPEGDHNRALMGAGRKANMDLRDATHRLTRQGLQPVGGVPRLGRRLHRLGVQHPRFGVPLFFVAKKMNPRL